MVNRGQRYWIDPDRHQLHRHDYQETRARYAADAHAPVLVDGALRQRLDCLRLSRPDRRRCNAGARLLRRHALLYQRRRRQHDELRQPHLDLGASRSLHPDSAGLRHLLRGRRNVLRKTSFRVRLAGLRHGMYRHTVLFGVAASLLHHGNRAPTSTPFSGSPR